ncbi:hypothetical protein F4561_004740 [Lipingzhangella halophila]|uniref:Uncharacterized protein n=1 Tax=Lipingzhangella halophila TaxID=1783352 RepID=A0A7W7RL10_9ACTN|nr:hypothetical protein [Lipingzhangella halophila]
MRRTYDHESLGALLAECGMSVVERGYQFRGRWTERAYLR